MDTLDCRLHVVRDQMLEIVSLGVHSNRASINIDVDKNNFNYL